MARTIPTSDEAVGAVGVDSRRHLVYLAGESSSEFAAVYDETTHRVTTVPADTDGESSIGVVEKTGDAYIVDVDGPVSVLRDTTVLKTTALSESVAGWVTVDQATGLVYVGVENGVDVFRGTSLVKYVQITGNAAGAAIDPGNGLVYLPVPNTGKVWVVKGTRVVSKVTVGGYPVAVAVDPRTHEAYVTNSEPAGTVSVIKKTSTRIVKTIRVGSNPSGIAALPRTHLLYVANAGDGTVSVIRHNTVVATDQVGAR